MKKVDSYREYRMLIKGVKSVAEKVFSNVYSLPKDLEAQIDAGRLLYEECNAGMLFYLDEEAYYKLYLCVDMQRTFTITPKEKPIIVRNIYREHQKNPDWSLVEECLRASGFTQEDVVLQARIACEDALSKGKKIQKYIQLLERSGFCCKAADVTEISNIERLFVNTPLIKFYQIDYRTDEEKKSDAEKGLYLCIVDANGELCAASMATVKNGIADGLAIAVKEQYKMNGFAPILTYERCRRLREMGVTHLNGWILEDNTASIKHHKSMGYQFTGQCADEWILDKTN